YPKGGTLVLDRAHLNPIQRARRAAHEEGATVGLPLVARLERALCHERAIGYETFVEMLPRAGAHVGLDLKTTDSDGLPAAQIAVDAFVDERERAQRVASLAREILGRLRPVRFSDEVALQRTYFLQAGTCRMGHDPSSSVCDAGGRVHGVPGLVICDGAALPT